MYGTESWQAKSPDGDNEKPWVEFHFTAKHRINRVLASSNREDFFETAYLEKLNNGYLTPYRIEVKDEDGNWRPIAGTPQYKSLNRKHQERAAAMARVQELVTDYYEEGPQRGFIATFIEPARSFVLGRGSPENPRDEVYAAGLNEIDGNLGLDDSSTGQERRIAFANWITSDENPLTSRVAVQSNLASRVRAGNCYNDRRFRKSRRSPDASGTTRLAGFRVDEPIVGCTGRRVYS